MALNYTLDGQPTSEAYCGANGGSTIGFDFPGITRAWVVVAQDGHTTFDGPMDLPMPPYTLRCPDDIGYFQAEAYEITDQGDRGGMLGQTSIAIRPIDGDIPVQQASLFGLDMSTVGMLALGAIVILPTLFHRKRGN